MPLKMNECKQDGQGTCAVSHHTADRQLNRQIDEQDYTNCACVTDR